jgi:predicted phage terminase large subunit-like protein
VKQLRPQIGPQEQFLATSADIALYGGAAGGGKTFALLLEALRHIGNGEYRAAIFRRTYPEITEPGSLWDKSLEFYPALGSEPSIGNLRHTFPSGAEIQFLSCQYESDVNKYQGMQVAFLGFDEATHFTEHQFFYLLSRARSTSGVRPYVRATCNPDSGSWLAKFIAWWIDPETGTPIPDRAGTLRWFIRRNGIVYWGDTPQQLRDEHGDDVNPLSFTFIPARLQDNEILMKADPNYIANLKALPYVEQERLLHGNWKITNNEGAYWQHNPEYLDSHIWCEEWPEAFEWAALGCDPSLGRTDKSDPSAIIFVGYTGGTYYIDANIAVRTVEELVSDYVDFVCLHNPDFCGWEDVAFQTIARTLVNLECQRRGIPEIPIAEVSPEGVDKATRIKRLGPYLHERRIRIRSNAGGVELYNQLRAFGIKNAHDDGPDATEQTMRLLRYSTRQAIEEYAV